MAPGLIDVEMVLRHRAGTATLDIVSAAGTVLVTHRLAPAGAATIVRTPEHHSALERTVLAAFTTDRPCQRKGNHPPGPDALATAAQLLAGDAREPVRSSPCKDR